MTKTHNQIINILTKIKIKTEKYKNKNLNEWTRGQNLSGYQR